VTITP